MDQRVTTTKPKTKRFLRSKKLIVEFSDKGIAKGWAFAVHECFRAALDIKFTPSVKTEKLPDGSKRKTTTYAWTQGRTYDFHVGDILYSDPAAYQGGLRGVIVQVLNASPAAPNPDKPDGWSHGYVLFQTMGGSPGKGVEYVECTQTELVEFLKTGEKSWKK